MSYPFSRLDLYALFRVSIECRVTSTTHNRGKREIQKDAVWLTFTGQTASLFVIDLGLFTASAAPQKPHPESSPAPEKALSVL